ncbi:hypothetical protein [Antarctobacter sp.]|uniref:COG3904 family protein n=1 Tax=Antarctobacter sp. TaxID=1872577 RepID=UPI002B26755C|nr:hypothetical protein [Antarctobacter sp.]
MLRLIFVLFSIFTLPANAAELRITGLTNNAYAIQTADPAIGCSHHISGRFERGDGAAMARELTDSIGRWRAQGNYGKAVICLNSPGGLISEALILADTLRREAIGTKLEAGSVCESACALVFMAGSFQAFESGPMKWRVMHPTARLGFHAPSLNLQDGQYSGEEISRSYALAMETIAVTLRNLVQNRDFLDGEHMSPSLLAEMLVTPPEGMFYIETVDQAGRWNIRIGPLAQDAKLDMTAFEQGCINRVKWRADASAIGATYPDAAVLQHENSGKNVMVVLDEYSGITCDFPIPALGSNTYLLSDVGYGQFAQTDFLPPQTPLVQLPY